MASRLRLLSLLFLSSCCGYAQIECDGITFATTKEVSLSRSPGSTGALVRQPDNSFYLGELQAITFQIGNLFSNYQNVVLANCPAAATQTQTLPKLPDNPPQLGVGSQILAVADFQNKGTPSVVVAFSAQVPSVTLASLTNFPAVSLSSFATSSGVATVAAGDFNKDGNYDFVAVVVGGGTAQSPGGVQIFLGNGDGTFKTGASYVTGANALHVTVADFNKDGKLDLAVCGDGSSAVTILLGNGDGTFHAASATPMASNGPVTVIAADFNNDQTLDLGVSNEDGTVSIFLGNGDGSFQPAKKAACGSDCAYLAAGDFNGDGKVDLAVTNLDYNVLSVLIGNGDGTFGAPAFYASGTFPASLIVTDFNNDGKQDILVATGTPDYIGPNSGSGLLEVLLGNGDGTFQAAQTLPSGGGPAGLTVADLNRAGKPDVVVVDEVSQDVKVFLGEGAGKFQALPPYSFNSSDFSQPFSVAAGDLNGDGKPDLATVLQGAQSVAISLGNGDGTFQAPLVLAAGTTPVAAAIGDLNGDGKPDIVVADEGSQSTGDTGGVWIFLSNGSTFQAGKKFPAGPYPSSVVIKDVNLDGKPDLVVSDYGAYGSSPGGESVLLGNGDGTFGAPATYGFGAFESSVAVGDWNGDGKPDLALPAVDANANDVVLIFLGKGDGTFLAPSTLTASESNSSIIAGDFNGDGKLDLVLANGQIGMSYFLGNGDGTFQPEALFNGGPAPVFVASGDFNGDGKPDLAITNRGTDGGLAILLNTSPPPPANLISNAGTTPQSTAAGTAFAIPLAVTATDANHNPVAGVLVTFTAPTTGASGVFAGGVSSLVTLTNASGIATAPITANASTGTYTVTALATGLPAVNFTLTNTAASTHPAFFSGEDFLSGTAYYLQFPDGNPFGYYEYLSSSILYHFDMGFEGYIAGTGNQIYFYDFTTGHWWYSSASLFPYLYDFTLNTFLYYFPNTTSPGHYTSNPRYFANLTTGQIISM